MILGFSEAASPYLGKKARKAQKINVSLVIVFNLIKYLYLLYIFVWHPILNSYQSDLQPIIKRYLFPAQELWGQYSSLFICDPRAIPFDLEGQLDSLPASPAFSA